jgi:hypothetical protein
MATGSQFHLFDRIVGGTLEARLREHRAAGLSYEAVARRLETDGVSVTGETVRRWCLDLGVTDGAAREPA